jgi:hypothetical protein
MFTSNFRKAMLSGGGASAMLKAAIAGIDSVDILVAGDSNTNYSGWGWVDGLNYAIKTNTAAVEYATPITPTSSWESAFYYGVDCTNGAFSKISSTGTVTNAAGSPTLGGTLVSGRASGPAALTALVSRGTGEIMPNSVQFDYGWIASSDWADPFAGILSYIDSAQRLSWSQLETRYRVVHGKGPSMGTIQLGNRLDVPPYTTYGTTSVSCAQASYEWVTSTLTIAADAGRANIQCQYAFASNAISSGKITGPMAVALNSLSTPRKGYAVTSLNHHGGASMDTITGDIKQGAAVVRMYLKEARERQIACLGSGKVIVCVQGGINTGTLAWGVSAASLFAQCETEWEALGYPAGDLAFFGFVSHQRDTVDGMATERASATALTVSTPKYQTLDLTALITYAEILAGASSVSYFANSTSDRNHLTEAGYKEISRRIVAALLA